MSESILNQHERTNPYYLREMERLVSQYDLNWCPNKQGVGAYFICNDLERAKTGKCHRTFKRLWNQLTKNNVDWSFFPSSPSIHTIKGEHLKSFKFHYLNKTGKDLGSINGLTVCDWITALFFLEPEKNYQALPIQPKVHKVIEFPQPQSQPVLEFTWKSEDELSTRLSLLSSYTHNPFIREYTVANTFVDQTAKTRRFDLVRRGEVTEVYELKLQPITIEVISESIGTKGYYSLAQSSFNNVHFYFTAPSILPNAQRLIETMTNITYISINSLSQSLYQEYIGSLPSEGKWYGKKRVLPLFNDLLPLVS